MGEHLPCKCGALSSTPEECLEEEGGEERRFHFYYDHKNRSKYGNRKTSVGGE